MTGPRPYLQSLCALSLVGMPLLLGCPSKDSTDDDDGGGGGGGGWDLGLDSGSTGDAGWGDAGGSDGGGGDAGGSDGGGGGGTDDDDDGWTTGDGDCNDGDDSIHPGADEIWYDGVDQDCDGADDYDQDGDGDRHADHGGADCDDTDPARYSGAYDRPDDGIDQDCADGDRHFDGLLMDAGDSVDVDLVATVPGGGSVDLGLIVDTTGSMSSTLYSLDVFAISDGLSAAVPDLQLGLAEYQDYNFGGYGSGSDKPFQYLVGMTTSISAVDLAASGMSASGGGDGPESTLEALYQALVGDGYDQNCNGSYDSSDDVRPFVDSADDAFSGGESGVYDASTPGIGTGGGLGFRDGATPVLVYITDNYLRDPDDGYGTPGGCPLDAGSSDVVAAASDAGAWLVGMSVGGSTPVTQMRDLARAAGSLADLNGDGVDDPLVYTVSDIDTLNDTIVGAVEAIVGGGGGGGTVGLITAAATSDPASLVSGIGPSSYTDVDPADTPTVTFTVTLQAPATVTSPISSTVEVQVTADGDVIATESWDVEVAPSG